MASPVGHQERHDFQSCDDVHCERFPCRVYKEGFEDGRVVGFDEGYAAGYADGYSAGYAEGYSAGAAAAGG